VLRSVLVALALLVSIVSLFYTVELWRGRRAMARVTTQAVALGEPLRLSGLRPAPILDEENFAQAPVLAPLWAMPERFSDGTGVEKPPELGQLREVARYGLTQVRAKGRPVPWTRGAFLDLHSWAVSSGAPSGDRDTSEAELALVELSQFSELLDEIAAASQRPAYHIPWDQLNPLFSDRRAEADKVMIGLLHLLEARAVAELRVGQAEAAYQDLRTGLRVAAHLRSAPALFYAGPRAMAFAGLLQVLWEGIASRQWTAEQLDTLQTDLGSVDLTRLPAERARFQILTMTDLVESVIPTGSVTAPRLPWNRDDERTLAWVRWFYPRGWSLQDQAALLSFYLEELLPAVQATGRPTEPERTLVRRLLRGSSDPFFGLFLVPKVVQMTRDNHEYLLFEKVVLALARTATALERYRLVKGDYPEELATLVPGYLSAVPLDPVDGSPLRYVLQPGGYRLYSICLDGQDDGGKLPSEQPTRGPVPASFDWVWALPSVVGHR